MGSDSDQGGWRLARAVARATRAVLLNPAHAAAFFWLSVAVALGLSVPLVSWARPAGIGLLSIAGIAAVFGGGRALLGSRLPRWTLQGDVVAANLLVTVAVALTLRVHTDLANLYVLSSTFAILYLPRRSGMLQVGAAALAYAGVLLVSRGLSGKSALEWLAVFGTEGVIGAVVIELVATLRALGLGDALTGLPNRRSWDERLEREMERCRRTGQVLSLIMLDLDHFKSVNDRKGHAAGDRLLQQATSSWQGAIRGGGDFLARLGGDEFAVLAPGLDGKDLHHLGQRLSRALPAEVSASWGAATWDGFESPGELLGRADLNMYEAKRRCGQGDGRPAEQTQPSPRPGDRVLPGPEDGSQPGARAVDGRRSVGESRPVAVDEVGSHSDRS